MRTISDLNTLDEENFQVVETNRLDQQEECRQWQAVAWRYYRQLLTERPDLECRPYQPEFAGQYCYRRNNIVGLSMGGGKTLIAGLVIGSVFNWTNPPKPGRIHIAVPNDLAAKRWLEDLSYLSPLRDWFAYVRSTKALRKHNKPILIYNQDLVKNNPKDAKANSKFLKKRLRPSLIIIDEVHNLKPGTARTKKLAQLIAVSKRCLALTGTLSDGDLSYIPFLCRLVYGNNFPYTSPKQFSRHFGVAQKLQTDYRSGSAAEQGRFLRHLEASRMPEYYDLMRRFVHRVSLDDPEVKPYVSKPDPVWETAIVDPTPEQKDKHDQYLGSHLQRLEAIAKEKGQDEETVLNVLHPLIRIANAPERSNKLTLAKDKVLDVGDKVAIFTATNDASRRLERFLAGHNIETTRVYANDPNTSPKHLTPPQRAERINRFLRPEGPDCIILQINLAAESIDLQNCGRVIFYDLPWSSVKVSQAVARVARPGNPRRQVRVDLLATKGLIDEHQLNLVKKKLKLSNLLFDYDLSLDEDGDQTLDQQADVTPTQVIDDLLTA